MAIGLYMDVHIPKSITEGLRLRGVDVLRAQDDGADTYSDSMLLDRSTDLQRVLFTFDDDLLTEATYRQRLGISFGGVVFIHLLDISIGTCIDDLELIAKAANSEDFVSRVEFLPL